ncbi:ArsR family transcriptional regulator [Paraburkholderia bannensis]|uniref:ArsR family transcriptional regulator n=1 Tax=Paraburkholderia bannensis TaxID=765414 RepID=UPI002AC3235F|nr:ArsR family transcriptional regulator [Paraburkholderia bannensis]
MDSADRIPATGPQSDGTAGTPSQVLPGATVAEFAELNKKYDAGDNETHLSAFHNMEISNRMASNLKREMTGYPPEVVRFEEGQIDLNAMLTQLPQSEREFYSGALATLNTGYRQEVDSNQRVAIEKEVDKLEGSIRDEYARAANDPVDRVLGVFNPPMGEGYLSKPEIERVDQLEQLRGDFLDAHDSVEREAVFAMAADLKRELQSNVDYALGKQERAQRAEWGEANREVDRIIRESEAQSDPAKRYEVIGRQLFQIDPGQDALKDKVVLAFTQRMYDSQELRDKLHGWQVQASGPLNAQGASGPKPYVDILKNPPPVGPDYVRDLNNQFTDVLKDASNKNYSNSPKVRAEKLTFQILEGVMCVLFEVTPLAPLGELVPSILPANARMGMEVGGTLLDLISGVGIGKKVGTAAKALAGAARKAEIDNLSGTGVDVGAKRLIDDAGERVVKQASADDALSPAEKAAAQEIGKKTLAEDGPDVDPTSQLAHEAVEDRPYGSLTNYADSKIHVGDLHPGAQPGILYDSKGDRYIELGGNAYHVRYASDDGTWRVFSSESPWRPQYPVQLNDKTNAWELNSNVGLLGGGPRKISDLKRQEIAEMLNEGTLSRAEIARRAGVSRAPVYQIARELDIAKAPKTDITPEIREETLRLLRDGTLPRNQIAARVGVSSSTVSKIAKENNIAPLRNVKSYRKITPEIKRQVEELIHERQLSDNQIKDRVGISRASVMNIRKGMPAASIPIRPRTRFLSPAMRADVVTQLNNGASVAEASRATGASQSSVRRIARKENIFVGRRGTPVKLSNDQIDQIFALRAQGKSAWEVAAETGHSLRKVADAYNHINSDTYKRFWWDASPEKRTQAIRLLDQGARDQDVAKQIGLPLETVRGIANQHRVMRDMLGQELLSQGRSPEEVADMLGISPDYARRLRQGVREGTHDIHLSSQQGVQAMDMFKAGYSKEEVAEKLGLSLWQVHRLANDYMKQTMDAVVPQHLRDIVNALNSENRMFTSEELTSATGLPDDTVRLIEAEEEQGLIFRGAVQPDAPGTSHGTGPSERPYEWAPPLDLEKEVAAMHRLNEGQSSAEVARGLNVNQAAIDRLYEPDVPLVAPADDLIEPPSGATQLSSLTPLTADEKLEIRKLSTQDQISPEFIASLYEIPLASVLNVLHGP